MREDDRGTSWFLARAPPYRSPESLRSIRRRSVRGRPRRRRFGGRRRQRRRHRAPGAVVGDLLRASGARRGCIITGEVGPRVGDGPRRGEPDAALLSNFLDLGERRAEVSQAERLAHDVGMQRDAHDERRAVFGALLLEHLAEVVDDHRGEVRRRGAAHHDRRDVVEFLRVRHRENRPSRPRRHRHGAVVVAPVQQVRVASFLEEVGRHVGLRDPRPEPARGPAFELGRHISDHRLLGRLVHVALLLRVRPAVADDLVAARHVGLVDLGGVVDDGAVEEDRAGQRVAVERLEQPHGADAVPVLAPRVVEHVR
mmetsp:Transcript_9742/g.39648  ORF Transcript_9742/g.39648 Transcript_9742/m.39648 type:complete len:312 (-) Transcript_9742:235-1170(-)